MEAIEPKTSAGQIVAALKEARLKLEQAERQRSEPIAIVGTACRMPGGAETPEAFWELLRGGHDAITDIPADRWDNRLYFDPNPDAPGKIIASGGGFVRLAREMDAEFFGIAPREAASLDPQQRLLLEVVWEALEDAGIPPDSLFGKDVGVFSSVCWNDYGQRLLSRTAAEIDAYMASGIAGCMAAGRLSHILGFHGPALLVDTACSSSLTAIHLACQSLRIRECEVALVGAASQLLSPQIYVNFSRSRMLSPDNRCKTFDASANGFVRSEGAAALVLKRLSDAVAAGDEVLAVVLGSAVNHDGHASGLTVPNGPAQQAVIRKALQSANLAAEEVSLIEAHGTGTSLGDPIEVGALGAVYGKAHSHEQPLLLGSVKSNVGHLEAAAGITSVLKVVLALQHREVPPNLHFNRPSPHIPWRELPFRVPTEPTAWSAKGRRVAGISSFGFSGTNVHLLLGEAPAQGPANIAGEVDRGVLALSAKSSRSLRELAARYAAFLRANRRVSWSDVCFSAATGRTHFLHRLALVASSADEAATALETVARGETHPAATLSEVDRKGTAAANVAADSISPLERAVAHYSRGLPVDWSALYPAGTRRRVSLPHYAFDRKVHWIEAPAEAPPRAQSRQTHPLLGARLPVAADLTIYEGPLSAMSPAFLADHRIGGRVLVPAAGFIEMALSAAGTSEGVVLSDLLFHAPLDLAEPRQVQFVRERSGAFRISARTGADDWQLHASGKSSDAVVLDDAVDLQEVARLKAARPTPAAQYYETLAQREAAFGPAFRGVRNVWREGDIALGEIELPPDVDTRGFTFHPALLDACLQVVGALMPEGGESFVPMSIERLTIVPCAGHGLLSRVTLRSSGDSICADVSVFDATGKAVARIDAFTLRRFASIAPNIHRDLYEIAWQRAPLSPTEVKGSWLVFADATGFADALATRIASAGARCVLVRDVRASGAPSGTAVDFANVDAIRALIEQVAPRGVVHCGALDIQATRTASSEQLMAEQVRSCRTALALTQAIGRATAAVERLYLITQNAQGMVADFAPTLSGLAQSPLLGFGRVLANEFPQLRCVRVDIDSTSQVGALVAELGAEATEDELALRGSDRWVARLAPAIVSAPVAASNATKLIASSPGLLDSLAQVPLTRRAPGPEEVEVAVCATGLGFRDVLGVLGMYPGPPQPLGVELSGVVVNVGGSVRTLRAGDEVFGTAFGAFASHAMTHVGSLVKKPTSLSHEVAAALPSSFLTAHFTLEVLGKIQRGQRVLIHAGAGGVGQAAVQIALGIGAEVFASAGSDAKRALLKQQGVHHVLDSRTLDFVAQVRRLTGGRGVDFVLNSLAEPFLSGSFDVLADEGCFLEIGKRGILDPAEARRRKPAARYHIVDLGELCKHDPSMARPMLETLVARIERGQFAPLEVTTFPMSRVVDAFRHMAQAKHTSKIVVRAAEPPLPLAAGLHVDSSGTYLITGGLGGLGLAVASHLVAKGAQSLVLLGRHEPSESALRQIEAIRGRGARVSVRRCDVSRYDELAAVFAEIQQGSVPLKGVVHAAGVLDDGVILQQSWARFEAVFAPKIAGAWNLHRLTTSAALDWLIVFGAGAAVLGTAGQSNYAAANAFLDSFAHWCKSIGLPVKSIDWGPWAETGMAARRELVEALAQRGLFSLKSPDALAALDLALTLPSAQSIVVRADWPRYLARAGESRVPALLADIAAKGARKHDSVTPPGRAAADAFARELAAAPATLRPKLLFRLVAEQVRRAIGLEPNHPIDPDQPLQELGLDSLMAVELRNGVAAATGCTLPATLAFDYPVPQALADRLGEMLAVSAGAPHASTARPRELVIAVETAPTPLSHQSIADLSEDEAQALLLQELTELRAQR